MSDFEALFGLLTLMFGLIVAELAIKFATRSIHTGNGRSASLLRHWLSSS